MAPGYWQLFSIAIVVSSVGRESSIVEEVKVEIDPLEGNKLLIKPEDVLVTIERGFGTQMRGLPLSAVDVARVERILEEDPFVINADVLLRAKRVKGKYYTARGRYYVLLIIMD
ncbi:MAG: hypothetical protein IPJ74_24805 [Saprospiraceae bacterium]|nr:hypothetical protein [Saprospiraceae bacterium]